MSNNRSEYKPDYNTLGFITKQFMKKMNTSTMVEVVSFTPNPNGALLIGTVSVKPLVNMVKVSDGTGVSHGALTNVPVFRIQIGQSAFIADPQPGDVGFCLFADRDISTAKRTGKQSNPGSARRFAFADAMYLGMGGGTNKAPINYIQVTADNNINIISPNSVLISAGQNITVSAGNELTLTGGGVTATIGAGGIVLDGKNWENHFHGDVQNGGGVTGPPEG